MPEQVRVVILNVVVTGSPHANRHYHSDCMSTNNLIVFIYFVIVNCQLITFGFQIAYSTAVTKQTQET